MQPRLVALLTLAFVLYVVASVGAAGGALDAGALSVALVAGLSALAPLKIARGVSAAEPQVALLAIVQALGLSGFVAQRAHALSGELLSAASASALGVLVLRLALDAPDRPPRLARSRLLVPIACGVAGVCGLLGVLAALPPVTLLGRAPIVPHVWSHAPLLALVAGYLGAAGLRLGRRRLGSGVAALAGNLWASAGLCASLLSLSSLVALQALGLGRGARDGLLALAGALLLLGHVLAIAPTLAPTASIRLRTLLGCLLAAACATALVAPIAGLLTRAPATLCLPFAVAFVLLERLLRRPLARALAPSGGKLLEAIDTAYLQAPGAADFDELATRVLKPLRHAAAVAEAAPLLVGFDPPRLAQLDAAGSARVGERALPSVVETRLLARGEPIVTAELVALLPRRPQLDPVVRGLTELDALCVLPLHARGELEGALVVARGARRDVLTLEELHRLEQLARQLGPQLSNIASRERAHLRAERFAQGCAELRSRSEEQEARIAALRTQVGVAKAALGQPLPERDPIRYSEAMRALCERLSRVAPHELPVLLWGEAGLALEPIALSLHRVSGRADEPFIVVDCTALDANSALGRLFGTGDAQPGLLELVGAGTLLLRALPALPAVVQVALAEVLDERRARPLHTGASYPFAGRIVATARRPLAALAASGAVAPTLARWLDKTSYEVPPLRARPEDLESLLMLALDRAARVLGQPLKGVEAEALKVLIAHEWPGNDAELLDVIERAAERAEGPRIAVSDLPTLARDPRGASRGSFVEQEREILMRALRQAGGSRTRAASALGLRRSELVERLRKLELEEPTSAEN